MEKYLSVYGVRTTEKVIEKSRFITTSAHVEGEDQAKKFIAEISAKFRDATHNCYAYVADDKGNFLRFSDDGEPQGTAGMPMLEVIKNNNLRQIAVVVTRYFGGIKLGAGGLVRAYSGATSENLAAAERVEYTPCVQNVYEVGYPQADGALRFFSANDCNVVSSEYTDKVKFTVAVKREIEGEFTAALVTRLNGNVSVQRVKEYMRPFRI